MGGGEYRLSCDLLEGGTHTDRAGVILKRRDPHRLCWSLFENNGPSQTMLVFVENSPHNHLQALHKNSLFFSIFVKIFIFNAIYIVREKHCIEAP